METEQAEEREITLDELIDLDFKYGKPKAEHREQVARIWEGNSRVPPGITKYILRGPDHPAGDKDWFQCDVNFSIHTITAEFITNEEAKQGSMGLLK